MPAPTMTTSYDEPWALDEDIWHGSMLAKESLEKKRSSVKIASLFTFLRDGPFW
jgi:hypothetical protein